jgi:60 kDa SS-A/Ro ribonucleoprotein
MNLVDKKYDRIILISDMQCWMSYKEDGYGQWFGTEASANKVLLALKKRTNSDPYLYSFDLAAYGTLQFPEDRVACVAGYDDKVFDIIKLAEQDKQALVNEIKKIVL